MRKWIILIVFLLSICISVYFSKEYSPFDILEIQETAIELRPGEILQLNVKGYKVSDGKRTKEVDLSKIKLEWYSQGEASEEIVRVTEYGRLIALKEGNANVQVKFKNKVESRPITVFVSY